MKLLLKSLLVLSALGAAAAASYQPTMDYWSRQTRPKWRTADVERGTIVYEVNATGTVKPILSVSVGSFVSGPITELYVDFNDEVKEGDLLARVDPRLFKANVDRDRAVLVTRQAEVKRVEALLEQARRDEARAVALRKRNKDFLADTEMDQFTYNRMSLEAQLTVAEASVEQAQASLTNSEQNLEYTEIRSPVDGIVIDRKIDPGQTLAAQFQTPELFILGKDMRREMHIYADVDETDIGLIQEAKQRSNPVWFTVDAYPDDLFEGRIVEVRMSSTTTQNVVTYPVVVAAANPELKLLPGMTATLSFEINQTDGEPLKVPNAALRFYPEEKWVHEPDRKVLDGTEAPDEEASLQIRRSASEKAKAARARSRRHVWVEEEGKLKAVEVTIGLSDNQFTELVNGKLAEGQKLVTGVKPNS